MMVFTLRNLRQKSSSFLTPAVSLAIEIPVILNSSNKVEKIYPYINASNKSLFFSFRFGTLSLGGVFKVFEPLEPS